MHFFFFFLQNYKLTFCINKIESEWIIEKIIVTNENGDTLNLTEKSKSTFFQQKCMPQLSEFQSLKKPFAKIKIPKYKVRMCQLYNYC